MGVTQQLHAQHSASVQPSSVVVPVSSVVVAAAVLSLVAVVGFPYDSTVQKSLFLWVGMLASLLDLGLGQLAEAALVHAVDCEHSSLQNLFLWDDLLEMSVATRKAETTTESAVTGSVVVLPAAGRVVVAVPGSALACAVALIARICPLSRGIFVLKDYHSVLESS